MSSHFKFFSVPERAPEIFGVIGRGDAMENFYKAFKIKLIRGTKVSLIGRKNGSEGCFTMRECGDTWDIAFYEFEKPLDIYNHIMAGVSDDAEYFSSDPLNKYLAMDLIKILRDKDIAI